MYNLNALHTYKYKYQKKKKKKFNTHVLVTMQISTKNPNNELFRIRTVTERTVPTNGTHGQ